MQSDSETFPRERLDAQPHCANSSGRPLRRGHVEEFQGRPSISLVRWCSREWNASEGASVLRSMNLIILSVAAVATTLPCLFVWIADTARRPEGA
jgi:hypothetical protein